MTDLLVLVTQEGKILNRCSLIVFLCELLNGFKKTSQMLRVEHFFWEHSVVPLDVISTFQMNFHVLYCFFKSSHEAEKCCSSMSQLGHCPIYSLSIFCSFDASSLWYQSSLFTLWVKSRAGASGACLWKGQRHIALLSRYLLTLFLKNRGHIFLFRCFWELTRSMQSFKTNCQWLRKFINFPLTWGCIS